jgi:hypothetical protein
MRSRNQNGSPALGVDVAKHKVGSGAALYLREPEEPDAHAVRSRGIRYGGGPAFAAMTRKKRCSAVAKGA